MSPNVATEDGKLGRDIAWNIGSLAILGVGGICQNIIVLRFYDAAVLGVFNQVFALYIFFSQLAAGGIHLSVLKHVAAKLDNDHAVRQIVCSSMVPASLLAGLAAWSFAGTRGVAAGWLDSPDVATGIMMAAPGLFLFALNKVLLAVLNAERRMKEFAIFQALRPVCFLVTLLAMTGTGQPGAMLPAMFTVSEVVLFVGLGSATSPRFRGFWGAVSRRWMKEHLRFGGKAFMSGVLSELNTRVDVLMLGLLMSDRVVGVYSFVAMIAEGFYQLVVIVRNNFNPILARFLGDDDREGLREFARRGRRRTWIWIGISGAVAVLLYPLAIRVLGAVGIGDDLVGSWMIFGLLIGGIVIASGYLAFFNLLVNAGLPGWHSVMILGVVVFNGVANWLLIPVWGAAGAAAATGAAYVFAGVILWLMARILVKVRL